MTCGPPLLPARLKSPSLVEKSSMPEAPAAAPRGCERKIGCDVRGLAAEFSGPLLCSVEAAWCVPCKSCFDGGEGGGLGGTGLSVLDECFRKRKVLSRALVRKRNAVQKQVRVTRHAIP